MSKDPKQKHEEAAAVLPDDNEDVSSEESEDDDLVLEGVVVRNPDVSSSSSDDEDDDQEDVKEEAKKPSQPPAKRKKGEIKKPNKKKKQSDDTIQVEFTFNDMDEKFFHGLKSLLHSTSTVYQSHSATLSDLMIDNIAVGTVVSTEGDTENSVFGFASVLNVTTYQSSPAIQYLKQICLKNCPPQHQKEMEIVLSGTTNRPAGFLLHGRMINMPLEVVEVLHQQFVLDMDWAVEHFEGSEEDRKALDFGAFVRLAPCQQENHALVYRYFDDEILAGQAEFCFTVDAPPAYSKEEKQLLSIMVLAKTGHRAAMKDLAKMIHGT